MSAFGKELDLGNIICGALFTKSVVSSYPELYKMNK